MKKDLQGGLQNILDAINNLIEPKLGNLKYDRTYRGKITSNEGDNTYKVLVNGKEYSAIYTGNKIPVGQIVKVKAPLNNFSDIYIETLPGSGGGEEGDYNSLVNKPILNTNITTSQPVSESELITGEMVLHKISKTGDYNDLLNKPTIPTKTSDLTNDSGFVDNSVSNLTNYYNKTETYTQSEVNNLLDNKANKREVMVAGVNRKSWTVSGSWGKVNLLPLQNNNHSGSGKLTYTTNGIKIGSGVTKVLASALFKGIDYSKFLGDVYVNIVRKKGTNELSVAEVYNSHFDTSYFSMGIPPTMSDVAENDLLYLSLGSGAGGTGEILGASLCVEVLE